MNGHPKALPGLPSKVSSAAADTPSKSAGFGKWNSAAFLNADPETAPPGPAEAPIRPDLCTLFRHSGWAPFRARVETALRDTPGISYRRLSAFRFCGADAYIEQCVHGQGALHNPSAKRPTSYRIRSTKCHDRFCVPCSNERSMRVRDALLRHTYQRENMSLIGLTLAHTSQPLAVQLDRITKAFKVLRNTKFWKKHVKGGASIIEIKVSDQDKLWHVHYHILAEAHYLPQRELSALWLKITGDSMITDVRRVGSHGGAIQYITKYITKAADASIVKSPAHLAEAITAYVGRRLVATFGTWRGLKLMERPEDEKATINPNDAWTFAGRLDEIIERAARKDPDALSILFAVSPRRFRSSA